MEWKGCELIIHDHDCDLWVTMGVGWVDVPYSDWGDFRRRRAVDISSFDNISLYQIKNKLYFEMSIEDFLCYLIWL